jgi:hypothetical protein
MRHRRVVLDVAVQVQHQCLGMFTFTEREQVLGGDGVQPAQPVLTRHRKDLPVGPVYHHHAALGGALFTKRVSIVPGDVKVWRLLRRGYRTRVC